MSGWAQYFQPHIWLRGMDYYRGGAVRLVHKSGEGCTAVVSGSEEYDVEVRLLGKQVLGMSCTCPYAQGGKTCKHMAAVLMAMENEDGDVPDDRRLTPTELANRIPETELRALMAELMEADSALYGRLLLRYVPKGKQEELLINRLQAEMEQIPEQYEDRHGDIGYQDACHFAIDIAGFIEERPILLSQSDSVLAAAELGWEAVSLYCAYKVDDSDGGSGYVQDAIVQLYKRLLPLCSREEKAALYEATVNIYKEAQGNWVLREMSENLLLGSFWGETQNEEQLQFLDEEIARLETSPGKNRWELETAIEARLDAMNKMDLKAQCNFMDAHLYVPEVRKRRAMLYLQAQDGENAIRLLAEGKQQAKKENHLGTEQDFSRLLVNAYEQLGKKKEMLLELEHYIFHYRQTDLTMLLRMKDSVPQSRWEALRSRYLSDICAAQAGELMRHEEMWEALLQFVTDARHVELLDTYEADLKGRYPQEMLTLYRRYLTQAAERANNRKNYYSLMPYLKKLCTYPGGAEQAAQLATDWRARYHRRSAMLDELKKAGF